MLRSFSAAAALIVFGGMLAGCGGSRPATSSGVQAQQALANDPTVVATVGNETITLQEFEREYAEGAGGRANAADDSLGAYRDFLERYVNFRLKVAAARAAGLEADSSIQAEALSYRTRMARPYMLEQEVLEPIMRELFARMQEAVTTSHILIRVAPTASPADTLAAYNKLKALADSVRNGADFGALALRHSEDPSARMEGSPGYRGLLGVLPPGAAVSEFEDAAYATPVGSVSPIFRTEFGYHILRVESREPAVGDRMVAHIMFPFDKMSGPSDTTGALDTLRSLKARVEAGEDFADLARQYSRHESGQDGGLLNFWFSPYMPQNVPPAFKEAVFGMEEVGDVSDVVRSPMGYHLLQLREKKKLDDYNVMRDQLRQMASRLPRTLEAQQALLERTHRDYGFSADTTLVFNTLGDIPADSLIRFLRQQRIPAAEASQTFMRLGDSTYTVSDLAAFSLRSEVQRDSSTIRMLRPLMEQFITEATINYAGAALESRDAEFGQMMGKFRNGLLLFRLMEDSVWTAATRDSVGLRAYYDAHQAEYRFPTRTRVVSFTAASDSVLKLVKTELAGGKTLADIQTRFTGDSNSVQVDTVYLAGASNSIFDHALQLQAGTAGEVIRQGRQFLLLVNDGQEGPRQKTFEEARPEVTTAYQDLLEQRLLTSLKRRYPVQLFPDRLTQAFAAERNAPRATASTE